MSTDDAFDDIWNFEPRAPHRASVPQTSFRVETIDNVEPLDSQFGVGVLKTVPDTLFDAVFGQCDPTDQELAKAGGDPDKVPLLNSYALLDAAKVTQLVEMLESSGLEHRCLFKGAAYDEMKDVAPWIVRLEEHNIFTRNLFTSAGTPSNLWDREAGIYIRSRATLDELWAHFRKFTKARDAKGNWYYIKYWEPAFFVDYVSAMRPEKQKTIMGECASFVVARKKATRIVFKA